MKVDFIIVGGGLAGVSFAANCLQHDKSFIMIDDDSNKSSRVAAGVYNPVVLKRLNPAWHASEQLELWDSHYEKLRQYTKADFDHPVSVYRRLFSIEEQNNWYEASDQAKLAHFLEVPIHQKNYNGIDASFGFGKVLKSGYLDINLLLDDFFEYLKHNQLYRCELFDYKKIKESENQVSYDDIAADHVIFAEGLGLKNNPWFSDLPLKGTKGETLTVEVENLELPGIVKAGVFILPQGKNTYRVGATYAWDDFSYEPTAHGREVLQKELRQFLKLPYKIINHQAGIRPTTADRKPFVGTHPKHKRYHVLNGLGTRGVMIGPYVAKQLFDHIVRGIPIHPESNISRFKKWERKVTNV